VCTVHSTGKYREVCLSFVQNYTTIEGLEPFTLYNISVAVKNSHGEGSFSEVVQSTTCEGGMKCFSQIITVDA